MRSKHLFQRPNGSKKKWKKRKNEGGKMSITSLTNRERQVFDLILRGLKTREIRQELLIKTSTVRTYYKHIYEKLFVNSKKELIRKYKGKR